MEIQPDFKELLELLNKNDVEFIIVGGYALAFHGVPRTTGDIEIFINSIEENAQKIIKVIEEFGFGGLGLISSDFTKKDQVIQLGFPPVRIDFVTTITGVSWDEARQNSESGFYGEIGVKYIGINELIKNKKATGRNRDLSDLESLGEP